MPSLDVCSESTRKLFASFGCEFTIFTDPATQDVCTDTSGSYSWHRACCKWENDKCVPKDKKTGKQGSRDYVEWEVKANRMSSSKIDDFVFSSAIHGSDYLQECIEFVLARKFQGLQHNKISKECFIIGFGQPMYAYVDNIDVHLVVTIRNT
eukprot:Awhi_evm1s1697